MKNRPDIGHWLGTGWERFLPRQSMTLYVLVAGAGLNSVPGDLEELARTLGGSWFHRYTGGLDEPVWWSFPDADDDPVQEALDEERCWQFEEALGAADLLVPATVRELACLLATLGVFARTEVDGVVWWSAPASLPIPAEVLILPTAVVAKEDEMLWRYAHEGSAQAIIGHVIEELGSPAEFQTTLADLGRSIGKDAEDARYGLAVLTTDADFSVVTLDGGTCDPERVDADAVVVVAIDWDCFAESRIGIVLRYGAP